MDSKLKLEILNDQRDPFVLLLQPRGEDYTILPGQQFELVAVWRPRFSWTQNSEEYDVQGGWDEQEKSRYRGLSAHPNFLRSQIFF